MSFTPSSASSKRVHFNREVSKWSLGSNTPTIQRLSTVSSNSTSSENQENLGSCKKANRLPNTNTNSSSNDTNLITVGVRVRPLNAKEKAAGYHNILRINEEKTELVVNDRSNKHHTFSCDFVITNQQKSLSSELIEDSEDSQQLYVYEKIGKPLLNKAYDGYNVSIFAYGQTGSGKTYSMIGTSEQPGLIPRFFEDLFERKAQRDQIVSSTHVEISYYEIYNEKIYDLLRSADSKDSKEGNQAWVMRIDE